MVLDLFVGKSGGVVLGAPTPCGTILLKVILWKKFTFSL